MIFIVGDVAGKSRNIVAGNLRNGMVVFGGIAGAVALIRIFLTLHPYQISARTGLS
jgi:hypothetical protein